MIATHKRRRPRVVTSSMAYALVPPRVAPVVALAARSTPLLRRAGATAATWLLVAVRASWRLGRPARVVMVAVATGISLAILWLVVLPVLGALLSAVWAIAAVFVALGASLKILAWAIGPPAVQAAAAQLGMAVLVCWLGSLVAASWATYRVTRRLT